MKKKLSTDVSPEIRRAFIEQAEKEDLTPAALLRKLVSTYLLQQVSKKK